MMKKITIFVQIIIFSVSLVSSAEQYPYSQKVFSESGYKTFEIHKQAINNAGEAEDLERLRKLCNEFQSSYADVGYLLWYSELILEINSHLRNTFDPPEYKEVHNQTERALAHIQIFLNGETIPAELITIYSRLKAGSLFGKYSEFGSSYYMHFPNAPYDEVWEKRRREVAESRIFVLGHIERAYDMRWNKEHLPPTPFPTIPPGGLTIKVYTNGQYLPNFIKDPVLKLEYIEALGNEKNTNMWWGAQRDLRMFHGGFSNRLDIVLSHMYSQEPDNLPELKQILVDNKISPEATQRILSAVAKARGESESAE